METLSHLNPTLKLDLFTSDHVEAVLVEIKAHFYFDPNVEAWVNRYAVNHREHYQALIGNLRALHDHQPYGNILDIGGVPGHIPAILKHIGFNVEEVDIAPERAGNLFASLAIPFHKIDIENTPLPYADDAFELVIFSEVLEHLRNNPLYALKEIYRVLQPGGYCLLSTPRITPGMRWRFLFGQDYLDDIVTEFAKLDKIGHMGHIRLYSDREVTRILNFVGFVVERKIPGGKLTSGGDKAGIVAKILRRIIPTAMMSQVYVWAKKE